ncbi:MAG: hypothetical protein HY232_20220 [Acidobacteria bacterium]|nr:hypothetical protein [Acidobacteriota bacterium]
MSVQFLWRWIPLAFLLILCWGAEKLLAQDPFEIQLYDYETLEAGKTQVELHSNFVARGPRQPPPTGLRDTDQALRLTWEFIHGVKKNYEVAAYLVTFRHGHGDGYQVAEVRLRHRVSFPKSWGLPVDVSLNNEYSFNRRSFEPNSVTMEIRPILQKDIDRWTFWFEPILEKALRGPDAHRGFALDPSAKVAFALTPKVKPGLEYYSALGLITRMDPLRRQGHILMPAVDLFFHKRLEINLGIGFGLTSASERVILKSIVGVTF